MRKRKNKVKGEILLIIIISIAFLVSVFALIQKQIKARDYVCNYKGELLKAEVCYEKKDDYYCVIDGIEQKVEYYYWEVK